MTLLTRHRRRFGLEPVLPVDSRRIEADLLRLLSDMAQDTIILRPSQAPDHPPPAGHRPVPRLPAGAPDLVLLGKGGRAVCVKIKPQAQRLDDDQKAFADLCAGRAVPFVVIRSLEEARAALVRMRVLKGEP